MANDVVEIAEGCLVSGTLYGVPFKDVVVTKGPFGDLLIGEVAFPDTRLRITSSKFPKGADGRIYRGRERGSQKFSFYRYSATVEAFKNLSTDQYSTKVIDLEQVCLVPVRIVDDLLEAVTNNDYSEVKNQAVQLGDNAWVILL